MIYATIDVTLQTHPKAIAAGFEAMGLWLFGMLYAHQHETDGTVHRAAVLAAWGGRKNIMLAKKLVDVGLWTEQETGDWTIHNYDKKNQKAEDIKRKREQKAIRQDRWRRRVSNASTASHVDASTRDARDATDQIRSDQNKIDQISDPPIPPAHQPVVETVSEEPKAKPSTLRYREAYARGIAKAKGSPYAWPTGPKADEWADKDLGHAIVTFAPGLRGEKLLGWIEAAAEDFVGHVIDQGDDPKFWSHFAPKGLVRFLNQDARSQEARRVG